MRSASFAVVAVVTAACFTSACGTDPGPVTRTRNPQVAEYRIAAPANSAVKVEFGTTTDYGLTTWSQPAPSGGGTVDILVAGMRANTLYHMRAVITGLDGQTTTDVDHEFMTGTLVPQSRIPHFAVTGDTSSGRGVELINLAQDTYRLNGLVTDLEGNVIWYYDHNPGEGWAFPLKLLPNGHVLVCLSDYVRVSTLREVDLAGNTIHELSLAQLNQGLANAGIQMSAIYMHHDVIMLPNGHVMVLIAIQNPVDNLPGFNGTVNVLGDAIVELDDSWTPVWTWSVFGHLDPRRHPLGMPDWTHANTLVYDSFDHSLLLSMRNQHWIIKIDYQDGKGSGNIIWRLGIGGDFALVSQNPADWFYGQHLPVILSEDGRLLRLAIFDDGNSRVLDNSGTMCGGPGGPQCYSRAAIYNVDEAEHTAGLEWQDRPNLFTPWGGAIAVVPNGNIEYELSQPLGLMGSRALEVTPDAQPRVVWQMDMDKPNAYRAYRIGSLYPGVTW